jgi:hypothetical protein
MAEAIWWSSQQGPSGGYQPWAAGDRLSLYPGSALWVRVAAVNDTDKAVHAGANLVVPTSVEVAKYDQDARTYSSPREGAENLAVGEAPAHEVKFFSVERRWLAGQTWMGIYLIVVPLGYVGAVPLLYEVSGAVTVESMRYIDVS